MSIYKRGEVWWVCISKGSGSARRRIQRSTGTGDEIKARMIEQTLLGAERGLTSRERSIRILNEVLDERERGINIWDVGKWYEEHVIKAGRGPNSRLEQQKRLNAIGRFAMWAKGERRLVVVSDVDAEVAWRYAEEYSKRGVSVKSRNNEMGHLRTAWKDLMLHGLAKENPWGLTRLKRNREEEKSGRAFTKDEIARIFAACDEVGYEWRGVCTAALYTGLRMRDVETLRWSDIDLAQDMIILTPNKTKGHNIGVRIPIHPKLREVLERAAGGDAEYVFPWRAANPSGRRHKEQDVGFGQILERAGVQAGAEDKLSFHCWRHTFVSALAAAGVSEDVRMRLAGHTSKDTHAVYTHADEQARAAIAALG